MALCIKWNNMCYVHKVGAQKFIKSDSDGHDDHNYDDDSDNASDGGGDVTEKFHRDTAPGLPSVSSNLAQICDQILHSSLAFFPLNSSCKYNQCYIHLS